MSNMSMNGRIVELDTEEKELIKSKSKFGQN